MSRSAAPVRVSRMYHPSHHVPDLDVAAAWFARVFGRPSTPLAALTRDAPPTPGYPTDYCIFTPISDVLFDTIDPDRYVLLDVQRYPSVSTPHLKGFGWYVPDMAATYRALRDLGIAVVDQLDRAAVGDDVPTAAGSRMPLFFTVADDIGLRYELFPAIPFPLDPRVDPDWVVPPVSPDDPLGIVGCSHHTVLTDRPERACRLVVDALGGTVVHEGRDATLGATATFVRLADSVLEYAVPDPGTEAHADWRSDAPRDTYHSVTWRVADLERVAAHLAAEGVGVRSRTDDTIVTDPATSLGIPWGFTVAPVPGDPGPVG